MTLDDALINPPVRSVVVRFNLAIRYAPSPVYGRKYGMPFTRSCASVHLPSLSVAKNSLGESSPKRKLLTALFRIIENIEPRQSY